MDEGNTGSILDVKVHRGLAADGETYIGPRHQACNVAYYLVRGTAHEETDYVSMNGTLHFADDVTAATVTLEVNSKLNTDNWCGDIHTAICLLYTSSICDIQSFRLLK